MTSVSRVKALHGALKTVHKENIEGSFVECGVWFGGNIVIAKTFFNSIGDDREVIGYDTFEGMTDPTDFDGAKAKKKNETTTDWCKAPYDKVVSSLNKFGIKESDVRLIKGDVRETLLVEDNLPQKVSILRLDTDFYDSTLVELQTLYHRLVDGGYLIIDDYGHWEGCRKAVDEFFGAKYVQNKFTKIDYTGIVLRK